MTDLPNVAPPRAFAPPVLPRVEVLYDDLWFCSDCAIANVNGDFTGIDDDDVLDAVIAGMDYWAERGSIVLDNDGGQWSDGHEEFMARSCDCCAGLPGERYRFHILSR